MSSVISQKTVLISCGGHIHIHALAINWIISTEQVMDEVNNDKINLLHRCHSYSFVYIFQRTKIYFDIFWFPLMSKIHVLLSSSQDEIIEKKLDWNRWQFNFSTIGFKSIWKYMLSYGFKLELPCLLIFCIF